MPRSWLIFFACDPALGIVQPAELGNQQSFRYSIVQLFSYFAGRSSQAESLRWLLIRTPAKIGMQTTEVMQAAAGMPATVEKQKQQRLHNRRECQEKNRHQQTLAKVGTLIIAGTPATVAMATAKSTGNKEGASNGEDVSTSRNPDATGTQKQQRRQKKGNQQQ